MKACQIGSDFLEISSAISAQTISIRRAYAYKLKYVNECYGDVTVDYESSDNIVIKLQLGGSVLAANNQLGVMYDPHG